jgi:plasmid stabilization system protein ParE
MANYLSWNERSISEYQNLYAYLLVQWGEGIANKVVEEVDLTLDNVRKNPEHYPVFIKRKKIRRCVVSRQTSIFFKINNEAIEILRVFDNRQSPRKLKL